MTKQAAAEKRLRERQAAGTRIPLYETQQQKVAADLVSKLPYILPPVGVLILTVLGFAVFMYRRWQMRNPGPMRLRSMNRDGSM